MKIWYFSVLDFVLLTKMCDYLSYYVKSSVLNISNTFINNKRKSYSYTVSQLLKWYIRSLYNCSQTKRRLVGAPNSWEWLWREERTAHHCSGSTTVF